MTAVAPKPFIDATRQRWVRAAKVRGMTVPKWVPRILVVEWCDCAIAHGEEQAASYIRKRKKELGL